MALAAVDGACRMSAESSIHAFFRPPIKKGVSLSTATQPAEEPIPQVEVAFKGGGAVHDNGVRGPNHNALTDRMPKRAQLTLRSSPSKNPLSGMPTASITTEETSEPQRKRLRMTPEPEKIRPTKQSTLWGRETNDRPSLKLAEANVATVQKECADEPKNVRLLEEAGNIVTMELVEKSTVPLKKTMKLRTDGRLCSPKKEKASGPSQSGRKPKPSKNKHVVVLKYGVDEASRRSIGEQIQKILDGEVRMKSKSTTESPQAVSVQMTSATPTRKSTHPFFVSKLNLEPAQSRSRSLTRIHAGASRSLSPHKHPNGGTAKPVAGVLFGSSGTKITYPPGSDEPLWPPRDFGNDHASMSTLESRIQPETHLYSAVNKKSKESSILIPEAEEVLYGLKKLVGNPDSDPDQTTHRDSVFPAPRRSIRRKSEILPAVSTQLSYQQSAGYANLASSQTSSSTQVGLVSEGCKRLFNTLCTAESAFDKFVCEDQEWIVKYRPKSALEVLQPQEAIRLLMDWLLGSAVHSTTGVSDGSAKPKRRSIKKRKQAEEFDDFIVTSDDEGEELSNAQPSSQTDLDPFYFHKTATGNQRYSSIRQFTAESCKRTKAVILCGPSGCGKTATINAIAQELGFEVFEINPGSRRSGRDILEKVGDMTKNHLVNKGHNLVGGDGNKIDDESISDTSVVREEIASGKQSTMQSFFKSKPATKSKETKSTEPPKSKVVAQAIQLEGKKFKQAQKQSLILLEEVDILFEEDKQFWSTIITLIAASKRPIIMTCNDDSRLPAEALEDCSMLHMNAPPEDMVVDYLLLVAAHEGHLLERAAVSSLYKQTKSDLRASMMQLNFWCQMAINDPTGGLNWMLFPQDFGGMQSEVSKRRVLSCNTLVPHLSTLGIYETLFTPDAQIEAWRWSDAMVEWNMSPEDLVSPLEFANENEAAASGSRLDQLANLDVGYDALSAWDIQMRAPRRNALKWREDLPLLSDHSRGNLFTSDPPLLQVQSSQDITNAACAVSAALSQSALLFTGLSQHAPRMTLDHSSLCQTILNKKTSLHSHQNFIKRLTQGALDAIIDDLSQCAIATTLDISPYIRTIVSYDDRLKQARDRLERLLSDGARQGKRQRTTRASRAALEGGHKSSTRRENWFEVELDHQSILETGGQHWQDVANKTYEKEIRRWKWVQSTEQADSEDELCS